MKAADVVRFALGGIAMNRLRSVLTTLGILIGVGAVILLVAVGNGSAQADPAEHRVARDEHAHRVQRLSSARARPREVQTQSQNQDLTVEVARALADQDTAPHVKSVSPEVTTQVTATYEGATHELGQLVGTYPSYFEASNSPVDEGTYFTNDDVSEARKVVVLGRSVVEDLFGSVDPIGKQVSLNGIAVPGRRRARGQGLDRLPGRQRRGDRAALDAAADADRLRRPLPDPRPGDVGRRRRCRRGRDHRDPRQRARRHRPDELAVPDPQPVTAPGDELGDDRRRSPCCSASSQA